MNSVARAGTSRVVWAAAWAAAAAARGVLVWVPGHPADLAAFHAWALRLAEVGPWRFYAPGLFADYLPGYLALLWPVGVLVRAWPAAAGPLLKAIPASADFAVAALLWRLGGTRGQAAALAYLLNPAVLLAGAVRMFRYLHYGLSAILGFVGLVMIADYVAETWYFDYLAENWGFVEGQHLVPTGVKLLVVGAVLTVSIGASIIANRMQAARHNDRAEA
ncbi:MAG: hypothetical protein K6U07_03890 [Firmicutes bacterium]|nr:hypothetical protein [Bacillota bacterium]